MRIARRELKTAEELLAWIRSDVGSEVAARGGGASRSLRIVRRRPSTGQADWSTLSDRVSRTAVERP